VNECVIATVLRRNEPEAFFRIKPLYGSLRHGNPFLETLQMLAPALPPAIERALCARCFLSRNSPRSEINQTSNPPIDFWEMVTH
jgi:hypothetical protein